MEKQISRFDVIRALDSLAIWILMGGTVLVSFLDYPLWPSFIGAWACSIALGGCIDLKRNKRAMGWMGVAVSLFMVLMLALQAVILK